MGNWFLSKPIDIGNTIRNSELYNYFAQSLFDSEIVNQYKAGNNSM